MMICMLIALLSSLLVVDRHCCLYIKEFPRHRVAGIFPLILIKNYIVADYSSYHLSMCHTQKS